MNTPEMSERENLIWDMRNRFGYDKNGAHKDTNWGDVADFILADRARIVEKCANIAESKAREIIDMQTGLRSNPALEIAESIRRAGKA